ncbi:ArsR/SmtB family transcription factor [Criibacterium bergeronii]|uniref:ArsR family transcriptional regulator n=1 Tax=Criibacterium bergeronii TaxID=1871336 RepID=A0A371IJ96_9FIRM|nr:metalloregulator ArsR/SmtB family transcription factor [Criibacterium bergeronii]MBS6063173.1 winged helix-turn-helix transcriptional regulator [Peptostreptococcaceae bacterium]RDY20546.1 ArsR family transcriptional regulator [Criibacterium bergeronii]
MGRYLPHDHGNKDIEQLQIQLDKLENFRILSDIFKHLGDSTRVRLFWTLCHVEECVLNLSTMMGMSSPAISHHLRSLKDAGLITSRRSGKEVYYKAADTQVAHLLHAAIEKAMAISCPK